MRPPPYRSLGEIADEIPPPPKEKKPMRPWTKPLAIIFVTPPIVGVLFEIHSRTTYSRAIDGLIGTVLLVATVAGFWLRAAIAPRSES